MNLIRLPLGLNPPSVVTAVIEIPKGGTQKIEYQYNTERFQVDRPVRNPDGFPLAYGFVPSTSAPDGDPTDIMILTRRDLKTGDILSAKPIGVLRVQDGLNRDDKILAVLPGDPDYGAFDDLFHVSPALLRKVEEFFKNEATTAFVKTDGWGFRPEAYKWIGEGVQGTDKVLLSGGLPELCPGVALVLGGILLIGVPLAIWLWKRR